MIVVNNGPSLSTIAWNYSVQKKICDGVHFVRILAGSEIQLNTA